MDITTYRKDTLYCINFCYIAFAIPLTGTKRVKLDLKCFLFPCLMIGFINTWLYNYVCSGFMAWLRNQEIQTPIYWSYMIIEFSIHSEINVVCCLFFSHFFFFLFIIGVRGWHSISCLQGGGWCIKINLSCGKFQTLGPKSWPSFIKLFT